MTYMGDDKPSLDELVHYGVKGMKWGVTRSERKADREVRAHQLKPKLGEKIGTRVARGEELRNASLRRQSAKSVARGGKKFESMNAKQQKDFLQRSDRKAVQRVVGMGAAKIGGSILAANGAVLVSGLNPAVIIAGGYSSVAVIGRVGYTSVRDIRAINASKRYDTR